MSVAGGVMAGLGILTGNKGLKKLGAVLSLTSGVASLANATSSTAAAAGDASSAWDAAGSAAGSDAAQFAKYAQPAAESSGALGAGSEIGKLGAELGSAGSEGASIWDMATSPAQSDMAQFGKYGYQAPDITGGAADLARTGTMPLEPTMSTSSLQDMASRLTQDDITAAQNSAAMKAKSLYGGASDALGNVGKWVKDNKELVGIGASILDRVYDPQAERLEYEKSLIERARRNRNNPIPLYYRPAGR